MAKIQLQPYLGFNGTCEEAMNFYKEVFGGELELQKFGEVPGAPVEDSYKDKVMHATLNAGDVSFMASDGGAHNQVVIGNSVSMSLSGDDEGRLTEYFAGLSKGGTVTMPMAQQVWGDQFGMLTDKFGINWMVNITSKKDQ